jgi:hypothetical protein
MNAVRSNNDFDDFPDDFFDGVLDSIPALNTHGDGETFGPIDLTGELSDNELDDLPDDFFNEVLESILSPPVPDPKTFNSLPIEVQSEIIAYAISKPSDPEWGRDFEDEYTGYDGSDTPE